MNDDAFLFITTIDMIKDKSIKKIRFGKKNNITDDMVNAKNKYNIKALMMIKEKSKIGSVKVKFSLKCVLGGR